MPHGARFDTALLANSYWKRLSDAPVIVGEGQSEPHLILRPQTGRLGGFGGCNRVLGSYRVDGERLELSRVAIWHIVGEHLELFDANGALLARLERRLMP